jgi:hypothetical protein
LDWAKGAILIKRHLQKDFNLKNLPDPWFPACSTPQSVPTPVKKHFCLHTRARSSYTYNMAVVPSWQSGLQCKQIVL